MHASVVSMLILCLSMAATAPAAAQPLPAGGPAAVFTVTRDGGSIEVHATATLQANRETVWRTLSDYTRLPDFIPDMQSSELLERHGDAVMLRQSGRAGIGPFRQAFSLTLAVREVPMQFIEAHAVEGDFRRFESRYTILPEDAAGRTRLEYAATLEPQGGIPPLVGEPVMRLLMRRQFDALLAEVERRGRAPQASAVAM